MLSNPSIPTNTSGPANSSNRHPPGPGCARFFARLVRGHWDGCESRNHWACDACLREDQTRSKHCSLNCALAALCVCRIGLRADRHSDSSGPALQERCRNNPLIPLQTLFKNYCK
ncbi:MAG: hypothetical protein H7A45_01035 [Verrucomicrobiales bacterium]|nr:hypothetical protein [Verrucomicrobiales bacterium]